MYCRHCGAANPEGSRFCGDCGATIGAAGAAPARREVGAEPAPGPLVRRPTTALQEWRPCRECGDQTVVPYFTRPANIIKMFATSMFGIVPAVIFFVIRKDHIVCEQCGAARGQAGDRAELQSIRVERIDASTGTALTLAARDPEAEKALRQARAKERNAIVLAALAVGFCALSLVSGGMATPAVITGVAALVPFFRSRSLRRQGEAGRHRHETLRILELASLRKGRLNVTDVAASLQMGLDEAELALDRMVDCQRVDVDVDEHGHVTYVFPELALR